MNLLEIKKAIDDLFSGDEENITPITCELADEKKGESTLHHCFACNMATSLWTLKKLSDTISVSQTGVKSEAPDGIHTILENEEIYRIFLPQIYLISEEIFATLIGSGIKSTWIYENLPFIIRIRKLMNFLKHPKSKGFFQHPQYLFIDNSHDLKPWHSTNLLDVVTTIGSLIVNKTQLDEKLKFAYCDGTYFRFKELLSNQDLKDRYLKETDNNEDCFGIDYKFDDNDGGISGLKYYELKGGQEAFIYFSEADINTYYSKTLNNSQLESLNKFCYLDNLVIILPTISSLLIELKHMLIYVVTYYKENPTLLGELSQFALIWENEQ